MALKYAAWMSRTSSGCSDSERGVKPTRSQKTAVTSRRSSLGGSSMWAWVVAAGGAMAPEAAATGAVGRVAIGEGNGASGVPHWLQNRLPAGFSAPQE